MSFLVCVGDFRGGLVYAYFLWIAVVGEKFIKKSTTENVGFFISCYYNMKVDAVSMISDKERNVSNFTERGVLNVCILFVLDFLAEPQS